MNQLDTVTQPSGTLTHRPSLNLASIFDWGRQHYRYRSFGKDELIPSRPGLIYLVEQGAVRLVGEGRHLAPKPAKQAQTGHLLEDTFLDLISANQPFEVTSHLHCQLQSIAQVDDTSVVWLYWEDLENWIDLKPSILNVFRYQQQRLVLRLHALGQRHTADRLLLFLQLLVEDHGVRQPEGNFLPFPLTHAQIASAIGATRVTVTRAMGKLRQRGQILIPHSGLIGLPHY